MSPDPGTAQLKRSGRSVVVGQADGTLLLILPTRFPVLLARQNQLRAEHGLPPLPDPATVTHRSPAVAEPDDP